MLYKFPKEFYWGAATSAHQVEGDNHNDWTEWEHANAKRLARNANAHPPVGGWPEHIVNPPAGGPSPLDEENYISGRAADHYHRFREDFDLAQSLGHNVHRFSIEWSRIEPTESAFDEQEITHYRDVIRALRERGMEPFVTIWHWTLPLWLAKKGGVLAHGFPKYFVRYTEKLLQNFGNDVKFWITINEPEVYAGQSYYRGIWPPQKRGAVHYYRCTANLIRAHCAAYRAIKQISPGAQVGVAVNLRSFESAGGFINNIFTRIARRVRNEHFLRHTVATLDFIGLNYYFHTVVNYGFKQSKNPHVSDMGWELYNEGLEKVLEELKQFKEPIYITENGLADAQDKKRAAFIEHALEAISRAITNGTDVRGYFHWSLLDNFEWDKGFWPRFGLIEVDYKTQKRTVRQSAKEYARLIRQYSD